MSTSFAGAKMVALLLKSSSAAASPLPSSSSSTRVSSSSQFSSFGKPIRSRKVGVQRGVRCEVNASDVSVRADQNAVSNVSALEQLKTSAAESSSLLSLFL